MATLTRFHLSEAVRREVGLPYRESMELVNSVLDIVAERLSAGKAVKISSFGKFIGRGKAARVGRNPKTGEEHTVSPRRVIVFRASPGLMERVSCGMTGDGPDADAQPPGEDLAATPTSGG